MNIQEYYRTKANVSLNASLIALGPAVIIIVGSIFTFVRLPLILLVLPFCVYSFISYQAYLLHRQYSLESKCMKRKETTSLFEHTDLLIGFMPAPTLRMILFDLNGNQVGEIKDSRFSWWRWVLPYYFDRFLPSEFILFDHNQQIVATYKIDKQKNLIVKGPDHKKIGVSRQLSKASSFKKNGRVFSQINQQEILVEGSALYPALQFRNQNGAIIGKLVKGWMPIEWSKHFRDANTPFISFDQQLDDTNKLLILGVLAEYFQYTSH
jgi:hypothetical protein